MRSISILSCALLLAGCGQSSPPPEPAPTTETPEPGSEANATSPTENETEPAANEATEPPSPPQPVEIEIEAGAFTHGRPIRLTSLEHDERHNDDGTSFPSPRITSEHDRNAMDGAIAAAAAGKLSCQLSLALERLVAMRCVQAGRGRPRQAIGDFTTHFVVRNGGIETVSAWSFFHPGMSDDDLLRLVLHGGYPRDASEHAVAFSRAGLEVLNTRNLAAPLARIPWRLIAPYLRADTPLGEALRTEGLELAPAGARMPALPPTSRATWVGLGFASLATLVNAWSTLPEEHRDEVRFVTPGGESAAALIYPPELDDATYRAMNNQVWGVSHEITLREAFRSGAESTIIFVSSREALTARSRPGTSGEIAAHLPAGTVLPAVHGRINLAVSDPTRGWTYIGQSPNRRGWVNARSLAAAECVPSDVAQPNQRSTLRGITDWAGARHAWFVRKPSNSLGYRVSVHRLESCTSGDAVLELPTRDEPIDVYFGSTAPEAGESFVVVVTGRSSAGRVGSFTSFVVASNGEAFERRSGREVELGVTEGGQWIPVRLGGESGVSLTWTGTRFEPIEDQP